MRGDNRSIVLYVVMSLFNFFNLKKFKNNINLPTDNHIKACRLVLHRSGYLQPHLEDATLIGILRYLAFLAQIQRLRFF